MYSQGRIYGAEVDQEQLRSEGDIPNQARISHPPRRNIFTSNLLERGILGRLESGVMEALVGEVIQRFSCACGSSIAKESEGWKRLAQLICFLEYEGLSSTFEPVCNAFDRENSSIVERERTTSEARVSSVSMVWLFERYIEELKRNGIGSEAERRWRPVVNDLVSFAGTPNAKEITKKTVLAWRDDKLTRLKPRTVKTVYLTAIKAVFNWAIANDFLETNPVRTVKIRVVKKTYSRPKGYTRDEAQRVLKFTLAYEARNSAVFGIREQPQTSAAKKWACLICAFTGARITEITQLRKQDIRIEGGIPIMTITPEAGRVKTRRYRAVPLHPQIVSMGFVDFVEKSIDGPLFLSHSRGVPTSDHAPTLSGRLARWLRSEDLVPHEVSPYHGWRHAFKTTGRECGIDMRILDAIVGHASRTAGDDYGDITIGTMKRAIEKFPPFDI